jgi:ABC-type multidrug transport system ATPase subunit
VIRKGELVALGSPQELTDQNTAQSLQIYGSGFSEAVLQQIRAHPLVVNSQLANSHLEIELKPEAQSASLIALLVNAGAQIEEVRKARPSLEEVFLTLMEEEK